MYLTLSQLTTPRRVFLSPSDRSHTNTSGKNCQTCVYACMSARSFLEVSWDAAPLREQKSKQTWSCGNESAGGHNLQRPQCSSWPEGPGTSRRRQQPNREGVSTFPKCRVWISQNETLVSQKQQTPVTIASCFYVQALQQTGTTKDTISPLGCTPTQHSALTILSVKIQKTFISNV